MPLLLPALPNLDPAEPFDMDPPKPPIEPPLEPVDADPRVGGNRRIFGGCVAWARDAPVRAHTVGVCLVAQTVAVVVDLVHARRIAGWAFNRCDARRAGDDRTRDALRFRSACSPPRSSCARYGREPNACSVSVASLLPTRARWRRFSE